MKKISKTLKLSSSAINTKTQKNQKALVRAVNMLFDKVNSLIDENRELRNQLEQNEDQR